MLANSIQGMVATKIITPVSAANTAAATSGWIAVGVWEGDVQFTLHTGAVTGSMASILQTADDSGGTGARTVTFADGTAAFTGVSAADKIETKVVDRKALGTHVKFVGTVTTGPILIGVSMQGVLKYS
jgi:hypothetical protein